MEIEDIDTGEGIVEGYTSDKMIIRKYLGKGNGRTGMVGAAQGYLLYVLDLVRFSKAWLEKNFAKGVHRDEGRP